MESQRLFLLLLLLPNEQMHCYCTGDEQETYLSNLEHGIGSLAPTSSCNTYLSLRHIVPFLSTMSYLSLRYFVTKEITITTIIATTYDRKDSRNQIGIQESRGS